MQQALALAKWVGPGRPVTAKGVLRRADLPEAGQVLGVAMPQSVRSTADVPALQRPWTAAVAAGLLSVSDGRAVSGPTLADGDAVLEAWLRALAAVLAVTFDGDEPDVLEIGRLVLTALAAEPAPDLQKIINQSSYEVYDAFHRGFGDRDPAEAALELMAAFGAVDRQRRITPLGRWALTSLRDSPDTQSELEGICQLKITLRYVQPQCLRRVLVPSSATLGDLHDIIQIAFNWDGDHLHAFKVGRRQYGDPYFDAEHDEDKITLGAVFAVFAKRLSYIYDFGDSWMHDITLEKVIEPDPDTAYPVCSGGRGDAPVEDVGPENPQWTPFDQAEINTQLAHLASGAHDVEALLRDDIEVIVTDAYGEHEQMTAFLTVLDEEIKFPVPATLLGEPVVVTKLVEDDATVELRAHCRAKRATGLMSFADLEFLPGTVEAWLHSAYLVYLGRPPVATAPPADWDHLAQWRS